MPTQTHTLPPTFTHLLGEAVYLLLNFLQVGCNLFLPLGQVLKGLPLYTFPLSLCLGFRQRWEAKEGGCIEDGWG